MERRRQNLSSKPSKASLTTSASTSQLTSLGAGDGISGSSTVRSASPQPQVVHEGGSGSHSSEPITMGQIVCLLCDASKLQEKVSVGVCVGCSSLLTVLVSVYFPQVCVERNVTNLGTFCEWQRREIYVRWFVKLNLVLSLKDDFKTCTENASLKCGIGWTY